MLKLSSVVRASDTFRQTEASTPVVFGSPTFHSQDSAGSREHQTGTRRPPPFDLPKTPSGQTIPGPERSTNVRCQLHLTTNPSGLRHVLPSCIRPRSQPLLSDRRCTSWSGWNEASRDYTWGNLTIMRTI